MKQSLWKLVQIFGLPSLWLVAAFLLYSWYQSDYQIEQSIIGLPREHNYDVTYRMTNGKSVLLTLAVMTAELIGVCLILRPWSYRRSIGQLLIALALFAALLWFSSMEVFTTSPYVLFHWLWLFIVNFILVICALISGIRILFMQRRAQTS